MWVRARRIVALVALTGGAAVAVGCGPNKCDAVGSSLDQNCATDAASPRPTSGPCAPRANTICTVAGNGEAGRGAEGIPAVRSALYTPQDVGIGPNDTPYIVDWNNHRIRKLDTQGNIETVAGAGEISDPDCVNNCDPSQGDQDALQVRLNHPTGIAFDSLGRMTIAAWHNSEVKRVDFTTGVMSTLAGTGSRSFGGDDGPALRAGLNLPVSAAYNPIDGSLWISDQANQRIRRVDFTTDPPSITTVAGNPDWDAEHMVWAGAYAGDDGAALLAKFNAPTGQSAQPTSRINFDPQGNLYLADTDNHCVRKIANDAQHTVTRFAGVCQTEGLGGETGPATAALLRLPTDVELGHDGTVYIADSGNHCVRAVDAAGMIRTVAGVCGMRGDSGDGMAPTAALLNHPEGLAVDSHDNLWIADSYNHRVRLLCNADGGLRCAPPAASH